MLCPVLLVGEELARTAVAARILKKDVIMSPCHHVYMYVHVHVVRC